MKALVFSLKIYSLTNLIKNGLEENGFEVKIIDHDDLMPEHLNYAYRKLSGLPKKIIKYYNSVYYQTINKKYLEIINKDKPDLIIIYNNQYIYYETILEIKKVCKITFYLGDNPLYSRTFDDNLAILKHSSYTVSPDSHWRDELHSIGMPNVIFDFIGYSEKQFFKTLNIPSELKLKYESNLIFLGRNYSDSSGYKRALFYNEIKDNGLKIFGSNEWKKWFKFFPDLQKNFNLLNRRISNEELNLAINCAKIYPIDQNPGLINGIHVRVFETIGSGTLPVMEWRKDIDTVFQGKLPAIKNYGEANEIIQFYLNHDKERVQTINELRSHVNKNYTPQLMIKRMLDFINL